VPVGNERGAPRDKGRPASSSTATGGPAIVSHQADARRIGELLGDWLAIRMDEVEALVDEARAKVAAIPERRVLEAIIFELVLRVRALELDMAELRKAAQR
jgi:hypothetical protein